jgi:hypothetical protein
MSRIEHKTFGSAGSVQESAARKEQEQNDSESDLRSLIELGCITDKINVGGKIFEISTLNASKRLELAKALGEEPLPEMLFEFNVKTLAAAVHTVNGKYLEEYHPQCKLNASVEDKEKMRYEIMSSMQSPVIGQLLKFYNDLVNKCDDQFDDEQFDAGQIKK